MCRSAHSMSDSESPEGFIIKCHIVSTVSPVMCCQILVLFSFLLPSKKYFYHFCILLYINLEGFQRARSVSCCQFSFCKRPLDFQHTHPILILGRVRMPPAGFSYIYLYSTGNSNIVSVWLKHVIVYFQTLDLSQH